MLFTLWEAFDVVIMTLAVGYIFKDLFGRIENPFLFSCLVTAPALFLHELGHKFTALAFGLDATFHAAYTWLLFGVILKLVSFPLLFFVPAYVSISGNAVTPLASALTALAGPGVNFLLFLLSWALLQQKELKTRTYLFLTVTKQINLFLFAFNMLPVPGFDGFTFYSGMYHLFF